MARPLIHMLPLLAAVVACAAPPRGFAAAEPKPLAKLPGPAGTDVAFSRDGKLLLTAGGDQARVWDAATYEPLTEPLKHDGRLLMATLSPDGFRVLTCAGPEAVVWNARTGERLLLLKHPAEVRWASFNDDGSKRVTGCEDGGARVWDASTGAVIWEYVHKAPVQWARLLPDGRRLVALTIRTKRDPADDAQAGADVHAWNTAEGEKLYTQGATAQVFSRSRRRWVVPIDISPDGQLAATAFTWLATLWGTLDGTATDYIDGRGIADLEHRPWAGWPHGVLFSPDGRRVAFACGAGVAVVEVDAAKPDEPKFGDRTWIVGEGDVETMAFSPDGKRLILGGSHGGSGVWDVESGRLLIGSRAHPAGESPAVAFSPDGKRVAAGFASDGFTSVWQVPERGQP